MLPKFFIFRRHTVFTGKNQRLPTGKQRFPVGKQRLPFFEFKFQFRPVFSGYRSLPVGLPIPPKAGNRLTVGKSNPGFDLPVGNRRLPPKFTDTATRRQHVPAVNFKKNRQNLEFSKKFEKK